MSLLLDCVRSAVYVGTIAGVIQTSRVATKVGLAYTLTNVYAVMIVVSVCANACCGMANAPAVIATAATIAAIAKVVFL